MRKLLFFALFIPIKCYAPGFSYEINHDEFLSILWGVVMVESAGDMKAYNPAENAVGLLQVRQCVIDDINYYYGTDYKLEEMYNPFKAITVFKRYLDIYGNDVRIWNGGPKGHKKTATIKYKNKVNKYKRNIVEINIS